jgi:hypothetical protein
MCLVSDKREWRRLGLVVAVTAACSAEPQRGAEIVTPPPPETLAIAPPPEAPAPVPAIAPLARARVAPKPAARPPLAAAEPPVSLEKLLQVPPNAIARPAQPDINELLLLAISPEQSNPAPRGDDASSSSRRLHVDVDVRTDSPIVRPELKREQVDATAALDVGNDTSIKGGIRLERDSNGGIESNRNTTPTIGIEKRF